MTLGMGSASQLRDEGQGEKAQPRPDRAVFSEYHGMGSKTAAYMVRKDRHKLVHYADYEPRCSILRPIPKRSSTLRRRRMPSRSSMIWRPSFVASAIPTR
jgi:hypothetical protein